MKKRMVKKMTKICWLFLKAGKFPPELYINKLKAAGHEFEGFGGLEKRQESDVSYRYNEAL
jgi:hypothetical protein